MYSPPWIQLERGDGTDSPQRPYFPVLLGVLRCLSKPGHLCYHLTEEHITYRWSMTLKRNTLPFSLERQLGWSEHRTLMSTQPHLTSSRSSSLLHSSMSFIVTLYLSPNTSLGWFPASSCPLLATQRCVHQNLKRNMSYWLNLSSTVSSCDLYS